jgi:hypothetical protein
MTVHKWRIEQLGGDRAVLELLGASAPHGRARGKSIFRDRVDVHEKTTYYSDGPPTRHIFAETFEPWELHGRFSDREGGRGYAEAKTREVLEFVRAKQPVRISWGDAVSCDGFIKSFDPGRESAGEVEWKLTILIDEDNLAGRRAPAPSVPSPRDQLAVIRMKLLTAQELPKLPEMRGSLLDLVSSAVSAVNAATGALARAVGEIASFERALAGELQRLRASIGQVRTAVVSLRELVATIRYDAITIRRSFAGDARAGGLFAALDVDTMSALVAAEQMDRAAAVAERGKLKTSIVARAGDTWQRIAIRVFSTPDLADAIRKANGVRYGEAPQPGRTYQIPTGA